MKTNFGIIAIFMVMSSASLAMYEHPTIALFTAACEGDIVGVRRILKVHDNVNDKDGHGRTALICAAINDHDVIGELLLARGAHTNVQIVGEWPFLKQAIRREYEAKCKLYIDMLLNEPLARTLPYLRIFHVTVNQKRQLHSLLGAFKRTPLAGLQPETRRMIVQDLLLLFKRRTWIKKEIELTTSYFNEAFRKVLMAYLNEQLPSMKEELIIK